MLRPTLHRCWLASLLTVACALEDASAPEDEATEDEATDDDDDVDDEPPRPDDELVGVNDPAANTCPPVGPHSCHPLYQYECPAGQGCYFADAGDWGFDCLPDISGAGGGEGQPCDYQSSCDPGLACAQAPWVPGGCTSSTGACCVRLEPLGGECPLQPDPLPFFGTVLPGPAPSECYDRIGICITPPPPPPRRP